MRLVEINFRREHAFICSIIPGLGVLTSFLFGWWANLDYYSYHYDLEEGPLNPDKMDDDDSDEGESDDDEPESDEEE